MYVTSHQMHNVLSVYSRQLSRAAISEKEQKLPKTALANQAGLNPEGKRQTTIERVSKNIFEKIARFGSHPEETQQVLRRRNKIKGGALQSNKATDTTFVFNSIDNVNEKKTNTLSVKDSSFLLRRFEQMAKESAEKKADAWI